MNTIPVTQNVTFTVLSTIVQLDAIGVNHHGLAKWNTTVPTTNRINTNARTICQPPAANQFQNFKAAELSSLISGRRWRMD
jgi:hypothetical protein